jgi:hypothetical protein
MVSLDKREHYNCTIKLYKWLSINLKIDDRGNFTFHPRSFENNNIASKSFVVISSEIGFLI